MAFSKGNQSTEGAEIKRYIGIASVYVRDINPDKKTLEAFYGREIDNEPVYVGEAEVNGEKVPQVRLDFMVEADEKYDINLKSRVSIFLRKKPVIGSQSGKVKIIDKYGRTAWATKEEVASRAIPQYANGPANIDSAYRMAYQGEEELINFLIAYLNIPSCQRYVNGKWEMVEKAKLPECEAMLEHIEDYFKGNFNELKEILGYQPNNKLKVMFGVRTADDGKQYQTAYTREFLKNGVANYTNFDKHLQEAKANGAYSTTEFEAIEIHEYQVTPTDLSTPQSQDDPFGSPWG